MSLNVNQYSYTLPSQQQIYEQNQSDIDVPKKLHFIHIKQAHDMNKIFVQEALKQKRSITFPTELLKRVNPYFERTIQSQLSVAKAIQEHPNCPVLEESLPCDIIAKEMEEATLLTIKNYYEKIFPEKEIPSFNELNDIQKESLNDDGAVRILFGLQKITAVYKSIHPEKAYHLQDQMAQNILKTLSADFLNAMREREEEAIACAKEAAIKHKHSDVLVVYGSEHDFKPLCEIEGFSHEEIIATDDKTSILDNDAIKF